MAPVSLSKAAIKLLNNRRVMYTNPDGDVVFFGGVYIHDKTGVEYVTYTRQKDGIPMITTLSDFVELGDDNTPYFTPRDITCVSDEAKIELVEETGSSSGTTGEDPEQPLQSTVASETEALTSAVEQLEVTPGCPSSDDEVDYVTFTGLPTDKGKGELLEDDRISLYSGGSIYVDHDHVNFEPSPPSDDSDYENGSPPSY